MSEQSVRIIEGATRDDVRPGDHITWMCVEEIDSVTTKHHREGIAHHRDRDGDWRAKDEACITIGEGTTLTVRRAAQELPTKCGTVIVANDGHKFIKAEVDGIAHRAREAVLGANGWWYGAWRKAEGDGLLSAMFPEHISAPTWKVEEK